MEDDAIRAEVARLARAHPSGGAVVERAAILAAGADFEAIVGWIIAHDGKPEASPSKRTGGGLHGSRMTRAEGATPTTPARYVLPPGVLA
jgi:hypothetical protein